MTHKLSAVCFLGVTTHCGCIFTARYRALASSFSRFLDHNDTPQSVGLLWTSEQSVAETSTRQHTSFTTGIRTHVLSGRAAEDLRLRPRVHWDRPKLSAVYNEFCITFCTTLYIKYIQYFVMRVLYLCTLI